MPFTVPDRWLTASHPAVSRAVSASGTCTTIAHVAAHILQRRYCNGAGLVPLGVHVSCAARLARPASRRHAATGPHSRNKVHTTAALTSDSSGLPASDRLDAVLDGLDQLNRKDPRSVEVDGQQVPYELAYSRWLTAWVLRLCTDAGRQPSEELRIAARGQHVERWQVPRSTYPEGRTAYLQWREDLKKKHAATTTGLMAAAGYDSDSCKRVEQLIMKRALREVEGQILEDGLCLVFLERQYAEFLPKLAEGAGGDRQEAEAKMIDILQKSWKKMGDLGRAAALQLPLEPQLAALVGRALAPPQ